MRAAVSFSFLPLCSLPCFPFIVYERETSASNWGGVAVASSRRTMLVIYTSLSLFHPPLAVPSSEERFFSLSFSPSVSSARKKRCPVNTLWRIYTSASDHSRSVDEIPRGLRVYVCMYVYTRCHCDTFLRNGKSRDHARSRVAVSRRRAIVETTDERRNDGATFENPAAAGFRKCVTGLINANVLYSSYY